MAADVLRSRSGEGVLADLAQGHDSDGHGDPLRGEHERRGSMTCETCFHCDHDEEWGEQAGYCTKLDNFFCGGRVPRWLSGCEDYEPIASPHQGDGDPGSEAA